MTLPILIRGCADLLQLLSEAVGHGGCTEFRIVMAQVALMAQYLRHMANPCDYVLSKLTHEVHMSERINARLSRPLAEFVGRIR